MSARCWRCDVLPRPEPGILHGVGEDPVRDHGVDVVAEQREVRERAPGLGHDHALRVDDEAGARDLAVGEQVAHPVEPVVEAPHRGEHLVAGDRHAHEAREQRPHGPRRRCAGPGRPGPCTSRGRRAATAAGSSPPSARSRPRPGRSVRTPRGPGCRRARTPRRAPAPPRAPRPRPRRRRPSRARSSRSWRTSPHDSSSRARASSCWPCSEPPANPSTGVGWSPSGTSNASASECAGSVEQTIVRSPDSAARTAVAAATVVLPTPPLPVKRSPHERVRHRATGGHFFSTAFFSSLRAVPMMRPAARRLIRPGHRDRRRRPRGRR